MAHTNFKLIQAYDNTIKGWAQAPEQVGQLRDLVSEERLCKGSGIWSNRCGACYGSKTNPFPRAIGANAYGQYVPGDASYQTAELKITQNP